VFYCLHALENHCPILERPVATHCDGGGGDGVVGAAVGVLPPELVQPGLLSSMGSYSISWRGLAAVVACEIACIAELPRELTAGRLVPAVASKVVLGPRALHWLVSVRGGFPQPTCVEAGIGAVGGSSRVLPRNHWS